MYRKYLIHKKLRKYNNTKKLYTIKMVYTTMHIKILPYIYVYLRSLKYYKLKKTLRKYNNIYRQKDKNNMYLHT